jgi:glycosyltransferase involved in cell wall biosynthesis
MSADNPEVSVIVPTRNRAALLPESVASVQAQAGVTWELIVVDDASTDGTAAYLATLRDPRCRTVRSDARGDRSGACNRGLREARGEFVMFHDDDDLLRPRALARLVAALRRHPRAIAAVGARWDWFCDGRGGGRRDSHPFFPRTRAVGDALLFGWSAVSGQNIFRAELVRRIGGFDPSHHLVEDRDFWLRLAPFGPVVLRPEIVMSYRVHPGQSKPIDIQRRRERVFGAAIRRLPREQRRNGLRVRASSRAISAAEAALAEGRFLRAIRQVGRATLAWPALWWSPLLGPWVARRLARRVWHRLRGR